MKSISTFQINLVRLIFLMVTIVAGMAVAASTIGSSIEIPIWVGLLTGLFIAWLVIFFEFLSKKFTIRGFSRATFGLMIGILSAWLLNRVPIEDFLNSFSDDLISISLTMGYKMFTYLVMAFLGVVLSLRAGQENFAFVIPYVRFRQSSANEQVTVLDESVVLDDRLEILINANVIEGQIMVPQFVFSGISILAKSSDKVKKERGERALRRLDSIRAMDKLKLTIGSRDGSDPKDSVHDRLVFVCHINNAKLVTLDDALTKLARLQDITVLNLDEISNAFQPKVAVGEKLTVALSRTGKVVLDS